MDFKAPRGTRDILPEEAAKWHYLEARFKDFCHLYGFGEIRTPIFEQTALFARSVGEGSDIVSKEMYSFKDRGGRDLTLRPELTAAVVRAYLENGLGELPQPVKLYYSGPMFRYDRPQAGRYRQFHQFGLETIGTQSAGADAEVIAFCYRFFVSLGLQNLAIELNSVGCPVCRPAYKNILLPYLESIQGDLCPDCRQRFHINPLRVFDCKEESCKRLTAAAPTITGHLCAECGSHFSAVQAYLEKLNIPFNLNSRLVRGLDYYTKTAFEMTAGDQGAQASLCGGGRYDHLAEHLGGPPTPAVGVAFGKERILLAMDWQKVPQASGPLFFVATAGAGLEKEALYLADQLRQASLAVQTDLLARSLKAQMKYAGRKNFEKVIIIGEEELAKDRVILRDMATGSQIQLPLSGLAALLLKEIAAASDNKEKTAAAVKLPEPRATAVKTHYCGAIDAGFAGAQIKLAGWVSRRRDHGGLIFIDLRDHTGIVQLVFDRRFGEDLFTEAESLRNEYVLAVEGTVMKRTQENINPQLATGEIEIYVKAMDKLNQAKTPPFYIEDAINVDENLRLRYRYLDLRRPEMTRRIKFRHRAVKLIRDYLDSFDFFEVETPMLTRSTPEGARDFLVPSRLHPGSFYALPQSPQLFKQLLMVSGFERYFQIARCFRDEDLRADRQPEFTQVDIEASFFGPEQLFALVEGLMVHLYQELLDVDIKRPFLKMSFKEAMNRFGTDKPDLRFGMELVELSSLALKSNFKVFRTALEEGGVVKGLCVTKGTKMSRKELDDLVVFSRQLGAKGLAWAFVEEEGGWRSPIAKFFDETLLKEITRACGARPGDLILFMADSWQLTCEVLGHLRNRLAPAALTGTAHFLWVVDFPLFEENPEKEGLDSKHHPFTAPRPEDIKLLNSDPLKVRALAYDLVLNGNEIGGGSSRIHDTKIQKQVFKLLGLREEEAQEKFGFLLEALLYGAPPHGGIALGLDRIIALLTGDQSIRQVIAFPKTAAASCLMTGAPEIVESAQLAELKIKLEQKAGEEH